MTTLAWSPNVGQMWRPKVGVGDIEIIGEHVHASMVKLLFPNGTSQWMDKAKLLVMYEPILCPTCDRVMTRNLL